MIEELHHLLIAVLGRTPQILTETLYGLCVVRKITVEEVWVISTQEGYQAALEKLIHPRWGKFHQLQQDYPEDCGQVRFNAEHIIVARDSLIPIPDIRTRQHSESFMESIIQLLWEKSILADTILHCSLAGGRKTMSSYMALALQLLGRPRDRLYHVLVNPPELENNPEFYYPRPGADDMQKARIDLVDIPFIRLRERVQIDRLKSPGGYRQILEWMQKDLDQASIPPQLAIDEKKRAIIIGNTEIRLQPQRFCLYWYFADRSRNRPEQIAVENYPAYFEHSQSPYFSREMRDGLLRRFDVLDPAGRMRQKFIAKVLDKKGELPMSWVLQAISRINTQIRMCLPDAYALPFYLVSAVGRRGSKCYGIKLDGGKIVAPEMEK